MLDFEEVDRPAPARRCAPGIDKELLSAVLQTAKSGRAIFIPADTHHNYGAINGATYKLGWAIHQRTQDGGYAVWVTEDILYCSQCLRKFHVVGWVASTGERLRRRDSCPARCGGSLRANRNLGEAA